MDATSAGTSTSTVVPYRAQASVEGKLVAESGAAVRVDRPGAAPLLWFPRADVDAAALDALAADAWQAGDGELADHVAFDVEQVDLSLVDAVAGGDERDTTTKRFPTWGDAADLVDVLDVRRRVRHPRSSAPAPGRRAPPGGRGQPDARPGDRRRRPPHRRTPGRVRVDGVPPGGRRRGSRYTSSSTSVSSGRTFTTLDASTSSRASGSAPPARSCSTRPPPT